MSARVSREAVDGVVHPSHGEVTTWWPARRRLAGIALAVAVATSVALVVAGADRLGSIVYVAVAAGAAFLAPVIAGQIVLGLLLVSGAIAGRSLTDGLLLAPAMLGIVVTAELLAEVARLDAPLEREPAGAVRRALTSGGAAVAVFAAVLVPSGVEGPGGMTSVVLASLLCLAIGVVVGRAG